MNPILSKKVYFLSYLLIWAVMALVQMSILSIFFEIKFVIAFTDGFISFLIYASSGLAVWFPVRFNPVKPKNILNPLINILITGFITVSFWLISSNLIMKSIVSNNENFLLFLENSLPYRIITNSLIFIVLVLVYSLLIYNINLKERISNEEKLKTLIREAELNMLKAQINPHFLFNSLNSINLLIKRDQERAREMIVKLSEFMRYSLRMNNKESMATLGEELDNIYKYLDIEKIRFGDKLRFMNEIGHQYLDYPIPNMILQPVFENAIKHGVYESTEPISIKISAKMVNDALNISVINNYDPEAISRKGEGIGLRNIKERLGILFQNDQLLKFSGKNGEFIVDLIIPERKQV